MDLATFIAYIADIKNTTTRIRTRLTGDEFEEKADRLHSPLSIGAAVPTSKLAKFLNYQIEQKEKLQQQQQQMAAMQKAQKQS